MRTCRRENARQFSWEKLTSQVVILFLLLIVVAITQVLPQVDLPDTAFHEDTAPIVTKARAVAAPVLDVAVPRHPITNALTAWLPAIPEGSSTLLYRSSRSLQILFSALLC